jgi:hypothetical protein
LNGKTAILQPFWTMNVNKSSILRQVDDHPTFTAEDGEADTANIEDEHVTESAETIVEAASVDDVGSRHNPFTGLEDWPIIVEEQHGAYLSLCAEPWLAVDGRVC